MKGNGTEWIEWNGTAYYGVEWTEVNGMEGHGMGWRNACHDISQHSHSGGAGARRRGDLIDGPHSSEGRGGMEELSWRDAYRQKLRRRRQTTNWGIMGSPSPSSSSSWRASRGLLTRHLSRPVCSSFESDYHIHFARSHLSNHHL